MSYDLAVWVGPPPTSPEEADAEFARRMDAMEAALEEPAAVDSQIREFVEAVLERYPELDDDSDDESPWASAPLIDEAVGDVIYFSLTFSGARYARDVIADIAFSLDLVCYDPQLEQVLPDPEAASADEIADQADAALSSWADQGAPARSWWRRLVGR